MWRCSNCNEEFFEPETKETTYESYYGVDGEFGNSTPMTLYVCPYCGSDEIDEEEDEDEEDMC